MAVKKRRRGHRRKSDEKRRHRELSARLAPLEETKGFQQSSQHDGGPAAVADTIRVESKSVKMPGQLIAEERAAAAAFRPHPVVVVIVALALAFIAFVAWQITLMPPPAK